MLKARGEILGVERPAVGSVDVVELGRPVGDQPREHVEPAGRALRVGNGEHTLAETYAFKQRHDVDAALLEHGALAEVELVHAEGVDLLLDGEAAAGKKARANPIGDGAQAKVEAGRLNLLVFDRHRGGDDLVAHQLADRLRRQHPGRMLRRRGGFLGRGGKKGARLLRHVPSPSRPPGPLPPGPSAPLRTRPLMVSTLQRIAEILNQLNKLWKLTVHKLCVGLCAVGHPRACGLASTSRIFPAVHRALRAELSTARWRACGAGLPVPPPLCSLARGSLARARPPWARRGVTRGPPCAM